MFKLWATIIKDFKVLTRDKVGLALMFIMPILLVLVITSLQVGTFEMVNESRVKLMLSNRDTGAASQQLIAAMNRIGMFEIRMAPAELHEKELPKLMHEHDALIAIAIPADFSEKITLKALHISGKALHSLGMQQQRDTTITETQIDPLTLYYHPVLQESYRRSIQGALHSALQLVESKQVLQHLYFSLNEKQLPESLEQDLVNAHIPIHEVPVSRNGSRNIPNATQHNIPAWTLFAMFFIVTSLGSNVVKEKLSGSFVRMKTMPTSYLVALASQQITYLGVCMAQVLVIFSLGVWLFPLIGLPRLNIPSDLTGLLIVSLVCGWCAISYAICIGVYAQTQEQANGFGAVSVVILAAIGGILVPGFAMPHSFRFFMMISPLHWGLECYYGLFLEGGRFRDIFMNMLPLFGITVFIQLVALLGLRNKNLI